MSFTSTIKEIGHTLLPAGLTPQKIVEYAITAQVALLPAILIWGLTMETLHAFVAFTGPWDMKAAFNAVMEYEIAAIGPIITGIGHVYFNKTKNSDGSTTETDDVSIGITPQPDVNTTVINKM